MRSLLLSGIVEIGVQMRVKGGLEKFGWKQGCVCQDLSTVFEMHPLVWGLCEPMTAERGYIQVLGVSHTTSAKSSDWVAFTTVGDRTSG